MVDSAYPSLSIFHRVQKIFRSSINVASLSYGGPGGINTQKGSSLTLKVKSSLTQGSCVPIPAGAPQKSGLFLAHLN